MNQTNKVKQALINGQTINQVIAFKNGMGTRLAAIIHRLDQQGWQIDAEYDTKTRMANYKLLDGWEPDPQQRPKEKGRFVAETKQP